MAAFKYKYNMNANGGRILIPFTITDSTELTVGENVKLTSGKLVVGGAGGATLGILTSIRKADGSPVTDNGDGGDFVETYTTGTSNTVVGVVDISTDSVYSVTADATLGTTTGSDLAGYNMDLVAASNQLDESTAATTTAQFFSLGQDPDGDAPTNSVLVKIQESIVKL